MKKVRVNLENTASDSSFSSSFEDPTEMIFWFVLQQIHSSLEKTLYIITLA